MNRILVIFALLLSLYVAGQERIEEKTFVRKMGISLSIGFDGYNSKYTSVRNSPWPGFSCSTGFHYRLQWRKGWSVEPGLLVGYNHYNLNPAVKDDPFLKLDRWRLCVPVIGGYSFKNGVTPLLGLEYSYYFSTTTSGQKGDQHYSSSQLWSPSGLAAVIGCGFDDEFGQVSVTGHFNVMRANKHDHIITAERNIFPMEVTLTAKYFFSCK